MRNKKGITFRVFALCILLLLIASPSAAQDNAPPTHRLFSESARMLQPSPVYDFLERALSVSQRSPLTPEGEVILRKVVFETGSWDVLRQMTPADAFSVKNIDGKAYQVKWQRNGKEMVSLFFPIEYELLCGKSRRLLEHDFVDGLKAYKPIANSSRGEGNMSSDSIFFQWRLQESTMLSLEFPFTDHSRQVLTMPARQLMQFCQQQGCSPYYIYNDEAASADSTAMLLLLVNDAAGYGHVVSFSDDIPTQTGKLKEVAGRVSMFLPFAQVTTLSARNPKEKSKPKRYE